MSAIMFCGDTTTDWIFSVRKNLYVLTCGTFSATSGGKGLQCDIGWYFLANPDLGAGHLLDMHVLQHDLFDDVVLLGGELDRPRRSSALHSSGGVWAMAPPTKNPAVNARANTRRLHDRSNLIPTLNGVS